MTRVCAENTYSPRDQVFPRGVIYSVRDASDRLNHSVKTSSIEPGDRIIRALRSGGDVGSLIAEEFELVSRPISNEVDDHRYQLLAEIRPIAEVPRAGGLYREINAALRDATTISALNQVMKGYADHIALSLHHAKTIREAYADVAAVEKLPSMRGESHGLPLPPRIPWHTGA